MVLYKTWSSSLPVKLTTPGVLFKYRRTNTVLAINATIRITKQSRAVGTSTTTRTIVNTGIPPSMEPLHSEPNEEVLTKIPKFGSYSSVLNAGKTKVSCHGDVEVENEYDIGVCTLSIKAEFNSSIDSSVFCVVNWKPSISDVTRRCTSEVKAPSEELKLSRNR